MRTFLLILAGAAIMYIILKVMSSGGTVESNRTWEAVKELIKLQQTNNLIKTNEFRELVKTREFQKVIGSLAKDQLSSLSKTLVG